VISNHPHEGAQLQGPPTDTGNSIGVLRRRGIEARVLAPLTKGRL
jgi:hypothetical protein